MRDLRLLCLPLMLALIAACGGPSPTPIVSCEPVGDMRPDCRFQNPEDLALLPDGETLIVSQFGAMDGSAPGSLVSYSLADEQITPLFPPAEGDDRSWGTPSCEPPDAERFSPHGIDLQRREDGRLALLVVNHGGRESIEFFEVATGEPALTWRGCVEAPEGSWLNDVVGAQDGGFWTTHMMPKDASTWATISALFGADTGLVYRWTPGADLTAVAGSEGPLPNGIERSEDERFLFINMYMAGEVRKFATDEGRVVATTEAAGPDNVTWSKDGYLLVASHTDSLGELTACQELTEGACGYEFEIVRIDPEDMSRITMLKHRGAPLGGVTVAVDAGETLVFGTFAGDRIVTMPNRMRAP